MSNHVIKRALVLTSFLCLAAFAVFGNTTTANDSGSWVSVDAVELDVVSAALRTPRPPLNANVSRVIDGIAILQLDDLQMDDLSRGMHENFHKCGGFVQHANEADAVAFVERMSAADRDAPSIVYTIDNQAAVNILLPEAREADNRQTIIDLSAFPNRRYNQQSGLDSANWIKNKWTEMAARRGNNVTVEFVNHPSNISPQPSVVLTIRGSVFPDEIIVLGAHQDSINGAGSTQPAPGADDDASGVACLTEIIRVLTSKTFRPARTVKFMAYAAEEVGLRGSKAIADAYRAANTNVIGVLQLDMTNYKAQGNDIAVITDFTNAAQNQFIRDLLTAYQPTLQVVNSACGYACSDHASWSNRSYPASFPFEAPMGSDNPWIHTSSDTISQSGTNANHALKFTKLGLSYVAELAKGCVSPRLLCSAVEPTRTAGPPLKLTGTTKNSSQSVFLDPMSF